MKQLVEIMLLPSGLVGLLVVAAGVLFFIFKRRHAAGYTITAAALTYVVFGSGLAAFWLMGPLEHEFAPGQDTKMATPIDSVVVLTGYALPDPRTPITGHVNSASGFRLLEATRIFTRTRRMTVIISGNGEVPGIMKDLLAELVFRTSTLSRSRTQPIPTRAPSIFETGLPGSVLPGDIRRTHAARTAGFPQAGAIGCYRRPPTICLHRRCATLVLYPPGNIWRYPIWRSMSTSD